MMHEAATCSPVQHTKCCAPSLAKSLNRELRNQQRFTRFFASQQSGLASAHDLARSKIPLTQAYDTAIGSDDL